MLFPVLEHVPEELELGHWFTGNKKEKRSSDFLSTYKTTSGIHKATAVNVILENVNKKKILRCDLELNI
jgi:hypothetical protein